MENLAILSEYKKIVSQVSDEISEFHLDWILEPFTQEPEFKKSFFSNKSPEFG